MKQHYIENQPKNQIQQSIKDAFYGTNQTNLNGKAVRSAMPQSPLPRRGRGEASGFNYCKGPPGRSRSPGEASHLFPEHPPDHFTANENHLKTDLKPLINAIKVRQRAEIHLNTESQIVIKTQILKPFKFFIMKKQILFLAFFVLAVVANVNKSYGQTAVQGSAPKPLTCANGPLTPVAGQSYDYSATFAPDGGTAFWYATKSTNITTASARTATVEAIGGSVVSAASNYATAQSPTSGASTTSITWNSAGLAGVTAAAPLLVVVEYEAATANCANNLKVFNIIPKNAFTVDVRSMEDDGTGPAAYGTKTTQCTDDVESATYSATTPSMNMDYGDQTLYFEVIAANFSTSFTPSYQITGLAAGQTAEIFWGYTVATATNSLGAIVNSTTVAGAAANTALTNTKDGVSIYVKVVIQNDKFENLAGQTITLAVDAKNAENQDDVLESDCTTNAAFADNAAIDITARPTVTPGFPAFLPEN